MEDVKTLLRRHTLEELIRKARVEDNHLPLAIHLAMCEDVGKDDSSHDAAFDNGYNAGWEDALMRASNAMNAAIDELEK